MEIKYREVLIGFLISLCLTSILTVIPVWQLVIIPGIIVGLVIKRIKIAALSSGLGILVSWLIYALFGLISHNLYIILEVFGTLLLGPGFGWLIIILILVLGFIFGLLGALIGNLSYRVFQERSVKKEREDIKDST
ncbi:MAG: hypothetical protein ACTSRH_11750 [Promethearchaeota archaeon]